jgi:hypothetical protein
MARSSTARSSARPISPVLLARAQELGRTDQAADVLGAEGRTGRRAHAALQGTARMAAAMLAAMRRIALAWIFSDTAGREGK